MNIVQLDGIIKNIRFSHWCNDIEFYKADLIVNRENSNREDIITIKFKKFSNNYKDGDKVSLIGNIRTYCQKLESKNTVDVYVFTYFDDKQEDVKNKVQLDGRICKINSSKKTMQGKDVIDFTLANNLISESGTLNCYIPICAWGKNAKQLKKLPIGTRIKLEGTLQSREYRKMTSDTDFDLHIAHEVVIDNWEVV